MTKYTDVIYPDVENDYPQKLCNILYKKFMNKKGKLLDIGCGKGTHMACFKNCGLDVYGIDKRIERDYIKRCNIEEDRIPFEDNTFDYIFSKSLIEHIYSPENMLKEAYRVLKPGGKIIIMTPDWRSDYKIFWDDYTHVHPYTRKSLKDVILIHNFNNVICERFYQLPIIWKYPKFKYICKLFSILPDSLKWKTKNERNGEDRKFIRNCKELMLLSIGEKL